MAEMVGFPEAFAAVLAEVAPVLDERARRLLLGAGARQLGRGGVKLIAAVTGASAGRVGEGGAGAVGGGCTSAGAGWDQADRGRYWGCGGHGREGCRGAGGGDCGRWAGPRAWCWAETRRVSRSGLVAGAGRAWGCREA